MSIGVGLALNVERFGWCRHTCNYHRHKGDWGVWALFPSRTSPEPATSLVDGYLTKRQRRDRGCAPQPLTRFSTPCRISETFFGWAPTPTGHRLMEPRRCSAKGGGVVELYAPRNLRPFPPPSRSTKVNAAAPCPAACVPFLSRSPHMAPTAAWAQAPFCASCSNLTHVPNPTGASPATR